MDGITSRDFMNEDCNCISRDCVNDSRCMYNGECRKKMVVYKATCKKCNKFYIGNTQRNVKERINDHLSETKKLVNTGKRSDSFSQHFASHFEQDEMTTIGEIRKMVDVKLLWQGNPISCMKTFRKLNCSLYMREKCEILNASIQ